MVAAKDIQKQLNTGKIDFDYPADVNTEPDQKLGLFLFLLDEKYPCMEPSALCYASNSQKFLQNALWKKAAVPQEAELFIRLLEGCIPGKIHTVHNKFMMQ